MNLRLFSILLMLFAISCTSPRKQWVSTVQVNPKEVPVSKDFLDRVAANWYYNKKTKYYGVNIGFDTYVDNVRYAGFKEVQKLNTQQFFKIFGQPDKIDDGKMIYLYIDYQTRKKISYSYDYGSGTPTYYVAAYYSTDSIHNKILLGKTHDGEVYYAEKLKLSQVISSISICISDANAYKKEQERINNIVKKAMRNYFFYNAKAGHYICIDGFPLPSSCVSKSEVMRLFGKPSKIDTNGDLLYYISKPNYYGYPNVIKWSPLSNGQYVMDRIIA